MHTLADGWSVGHPSMTSPDRFSGVGTEAVGRPLRQLAELCDVRVPRVTVVSVSTED